MNINEVGQQLANILSKSSSLFISSGDEFARELTLGQVIKGKVLRSYDSGRYQVDFSGQKKTVDSAIPLKTGELIHGRVINVGEQIEIKRLPVEREQVSQLDNLNAGNKVDLNLVGKWEALLIQGMRNYHVKFSVMQSADIIKAMKQAKTPDRILLAAAALVKQNIGLNRELLLMLNKLQSKQQGLSLFDIDQQIPQLVVDNNIDETNIGRSTPLENRQHIQNMATVISQIVVEQENKARSEAVNNKSGMDNDIGVVKDISSTAKQNTDAEFSNNSSRSFSDIWYLVNNQVGGSVQHRVTTLPIWVNDKLIEVDVVMYEQRKNLKKHTGIDNKKIIFSLDLNNLGHVSVEILLNNEHVKMAISTESAISTEALLAHGVELTKNIKDQNWALDEMSYLTKDKDETGNIIGSILEHYVSQDSLSRLM